MEVDPQLLMAGAWLWDAYGKEIIDSAVGGFSEKWKEVNWFKASNNYRTGVKESFSQMRILYKTDTVPLDEHYVDLYVLDERTADKWYGISDLQSEFDETLRFTRRDKPESAKSIIDQNNKLFIFGKPGSGKTTLLKYLATLAALKEIDKVPILISLSDWAFSKKGIKDFIGEQFEICGFPDAGVFIEKLLGKGNALVLFDGLDEVSEDAGERNRIFRELENFIKQFDRNKICISCRASAINYVFEGKEKFKYVEIADFSLLQVSTFVKKWYVNNPTQSEKFLAALYQETHENLQEMSHNPLLLGLLCLVFEKSSSFPSNRAEIYRDAIDGLLSRWDGQQGVQRDVITKGFTSIVKRDLLSILAFHYFQRGEIFFDQEDISRHAAKFLKKLLDNPHEIDGEKIVQAIEEQHGLLTKRAIRIYSFSHLTFQEYFAARYIVDHASDEVFETIFTHLTNPWWRELYQLLAGLLPNADLFFSFFQDAVEKLVKKDDVLVTALKWAKRISENRETENIFEVRMVALDNIQKIEQFINRVYSLIEESDYNLSEYFAGLLNLELDIDIDRDDAISLVKSLIHREPLSGRFASKFKKFLKLSYQRSTDFDDRTVDFKNINSNEIRLKLRESLILFLVHIEEQLRSNVDAVAQELLSPEHINIIAELNLPMFNPTKQIWRVFVRDVYKKLLDLNTGGKVLRLSDAQVIQIEQYIRANFLLEKCLKDAKVSNSLNLKNKLLTIS